jgi:flavin-binding protein dodecin
MALYRVIRLIGSSQDSWEDAAKSALEEAATHLEDLRVAEVSNSISGSKRTKLSNIEPAFEHPSAIIRR